MDQEEAVKITETTYAERKKKEELAKAENSPKVAIRIPSRYTLIEVSKVHELANRNFDQKAILHD